MFERMLYTLGTLFKHLHLLITQSHVVKHDEQMVQISSAWGKVDRIHDTVSLLKKIERSFELVLFDKGYGTFIELCQHNGNLILGNTELFVIMFVEKIVFLVLLVIGGYTILCITGLLRHSVWFWGTSKSLFVHSLTALHILNLVYQIL